MRGRWRRSSPTRASRRRNCAGSVERNAAFYAQRIIPSFTKPVRSLGSGFHRKDTRNLHTAISNVIQRTPEYPFRKLSPNRANPAASARDELAMGKTETETETINPRHGASLKEYDHAS
jgi:hypothetical protein